MFIHCTNIFSVCNNRLGEFFETLKQNNWCFNYGITQVLCTVSSLLRIQQPHMSYNERHFIIVCFFSTGKARGKKNPTLFMDLQISDGSKVRHKAVLVLLQKYQDRILRH